MKKMKCCEYVPWCFAATKFIYGPLCVNIKMQNNNVWPQQPLKTCRYHKTFYNLN